MGPGFSPLDEELRLLPGALTPTLHERLVRLGTWLPFRRAAQTLADFTRVRVGEATARRLTEQAGAAYVAWEDRESARIRQTQPRAPVGPAVQQVSVDGAMVPLRDGTWAEVKTLAIGTVVPCRRRHGQPGVRAVEGSYFSRLAEAETFIEQATAEVHRRGVETAGTVAGVVDGAVWEQGFFAVHRPDAVRILDNPHAREHLNTAAQAVWGASSAAATAWLSEQAKELTTGDPGTVLTALRALPVTTAIDPAAAPRERDRTLAYLVQRWEQIQYASFLAQGLPIGSGMVESANKLVVEARLKGTGMRWAPAHVNPLVGLRTVACADRWEEAWPQITTEHRQAARTRQQTRRLARQTAARPLLPTPTPVPDPTVAAAPLAAMLPTSRHEPPPPAPPAIRTRPKLVVDGRPTRHHPWKRRYRPPAPPITLSHAKL